MLDELNPGKKPPARSEMPLAERLLIGKKEAAGLLSISPRALDYLVSTKQLATRRIGARVLIPMIELKKFTRSDHPERLAG
jgi:hypothetical protein